MSAISAVETLLSRDPGIKPAGRYDDLILSRQKGVIRRRRDYRVYLPAGYDGRSELPMVMVLHGCNQSHLNMQNITGFDHIADREQFIVVYPYITSHSGLRSTNCWGWWLPRQRRRDSGEAGDLHQIALAVMRDYAVDSSRLHVCGLSAGAAMSVVSLATYSDVWKSGATVAGVPYGESARAVKYASAISVRYKPLSMLNRLLGRALISQPPGLLVVQSTADQQIGIELSENLVETWRLAAALPDEPASFSSGTTHDKPWRLAQYSDSQGQLQLGYFVVEDVEHGWVGGNPGEFCTPDAPNVSELIWAFFNCS